MSGSTAFLPAALAAGRGEEFVDRYVARTPLARMATEDDFRGAIAYLTSDLSRYVTGQNLSVDGGWGAVVICQSRTAKSGF